MFVRVSTDNQNKLRQSEELKEYCEQHGYIITKTILTAISGVDKNRFDIKELIDSARNNEFDKVLVTEVSRIGRDARFIKSTIDSLHQLNKSIIFKNLCGLESLDYNGNESFVTNIIISIYSELAQEEKRLLSERVKSGLDYARKKGKLIGRPKGNKSKKELLKKYSKLVADLKKGFSLNQCMKLHNVSKNTVIKIKKLL